MIVRFRRSRGDERQQMKWMVFAVSFLLLAIVLPSVVAWNGGDILFSIAIVQLPVAVGIAMLKYRLYDIDRLISRTLVYGALTVLLGGVYVGLVLVGQALFSSFAGNGNLAIAASTLVVAALFLPVRSRVQRFVDRRFYRRRYDAQRTLEGFGARLREQVELETLSSRPRSRRAGDDPAVARVAMAPERAMSLRVPTPRTLSRIAAAISVVLFACFVVLLVVASFDPDFTSTGVALGDALIIAPFVGVGVVVTWKRPANLVGWALLLAGLGILLEGVLRTYAELALLAKPEAGLPAGGAAAAIAAGGWTALMGGVFLLLIVFPLGTLPSPRMRRFAMLVLLDFAAIWFIIATSADLEPPLEGYDNPLVLTTSEAYAALGVPLVVVCLVSVVAAAVIVVRRFRRSRGDERQQFKWFATSAGFLVVTVPIATAFNWTGIGGIVITFQLIALPVSVGIAVLRYRLYEIDVIIRRTLVYGTLSALLAGTYVGLVLAGQAISSTFTGSSNLAIAASTLIVAALFLPVRSRVQHFVDRRFYRRRYDAQRTLEGFGARLREQVDLESLRSDLGVVVEDTMQPAHVSVWLREGGRA